jgi:hypothetical protein
MRNLRRCGIVATVALMSTLVCQAEEVGWVVTSHDTAPPGWEYSVTGSYYSFRDQKDFFVAVGTAERGPLHLEARYNYEAINSGSLFAGWKLSGGEKLTWEVTPILGGVFGQKEGIAPGVEAALGYGIADLYIEAEYVRDFEVKEDSFTYSWNELGLSPLDWLRFGLVSQRSKAYQSERFIDLGLFAQLLYRRTALGAYIFNPSDSDNRFTVFSLGAKF